MLYFFRYLDRKGWNKNKTKTKTKETVKKPTEAPARVYTPSSTGGSSKKKRKAT